MCKTSVRQAGQHQDIGTLSLSCVATCHASLDEPSNFLAWRRATHLSTNHLNRQSQPLDRLDHSLCIGAQTVPVATPDWQRVYRGCRPCGAARRSEKGKKCPANWTVLQMGNLLLSASKRLPTPSARPTFRRKAGPSVTSGKMSRLLVVMICGRRFRSLSHVSHAFDAS